MPAQHIFDIYPYLVKVFFIFGDIALRNALKILRPLLVVCFQIILRVKGVVLHASIPQLILRPTNQVAWSPNPNPGRSFEARHNMIFVLDRMNMLFFIPFRILALDATERASSWASNQFRLHS